MLPRDPDELTISPDGRPEHEQPRWRQDFPIDVEQDNYVARRDFVKFLVLTSFAFVVGQFWIVTQNLVRRGRNKLPLREIASIESIPVGGALQFWYPNRSEPCVLVRPGAAIFLAFSQRCTHLSCSIVPEVSQGRFHCPCHEGFFDMATGRPIAGPPRRPLPRVRLIIRSGKIYAAGVEARTI